MFGCRNGRFQKVVISLLSTLVLGINMFFVFVYVKENVPKEYVKNITFRLNEIHVKMGKNGSQRDVGIFFSLLTLH
jgi:hypothetical protein